MEIAVPSRKKAGRRVSTSSDHSSLAEGREKRTLRPSKRLADADAGPKFKAGDRVLARWAADNLWYPGEVIKDIKRHDVYKYQVKYDDGDTRNNVPEKDLKLEKDVDTDEWDASGPGGPGDLDLDLSDSGLDDDGTFDFDSEDHPWLVKTGTPAKSDSVSNSEKEKGAKPTKQSLVGKIESAGDTLEPDKKRQKVEAKENDKGSKNQEEKKPVPAADPLMQLEMSSATCMTEVKSELAKVSGWEYSTSSEQRLERKKQRLALHKTPDGKARRVFDQGILSKRLSIVLGGSGSADSIIDSKTHPFAPAFTGDEGFLSAKSPLIVQNSQKPFHMFLQCDSEKTEPSYHGPNAANKCLYLGRYKIKNVKGINQPYLGLDQDKRFKIAEFYSIKKLDHADTYTFDVLKTDDGSVVNVKGKYFLHARATAETKNEKFGTFSNRKQEILAWVEMLLSIKFRVDLVPVEFVSYDESTYRKLVGFGVAKGEVSLDEANLGPL